MSIKISKSSQKNEEIERLQWEIEKIINNHKILKEIPETKKTLKTILDDLKKVSFENKDVKNLEGNIVGSERVKELIVEATGYIKWSLDEDEILEQDEVNEYKEQYGIDFKDSEIHRYRFCRSTNDRNSVSMITVTVLPGVFKVEIDTDRANYELDGLLNEKELVSGIERESDWFFVHFINNM